MTETQMMLSEIEFFSLFALLTKKWNAATRCVLRAYNTNPLAAVQGCIGGIRWYTPYRYTNLWCFFWQLILTYLCRNKTGYTGIYALAVSKRMCPAPCHTKLLNFFPCTFCSIN